MPVESAADRLALLVDFGEAVTWSVSGDPVSFTAIFDNGTREQVRYAEELAVQVRAAQLTMRDEDVPPAGTVGDGITVRAKAYFAKSIQPDGTGMTIVALEKDFS